MADLQSAPELRSSPSAVRNAPVIADVLSDTLNAGMHVVEVGSGTGQHAAYMVDQIPGLTWQPTDVAPETETIMAWRGIASQSDNISAPLALDVRVARQWSSLNSFDAIFSANTLHIMSWDACKHFFAGAAKHVRNGGLLCVYGPFHQNGEPTSDSNASFDSELRSRPGNMGIRHLEDVRALAARNHWLECAHFYMPANNQMLVWRQWAE